MKKGWVAFTLLFCAQTALGAVQYEFRQSGRSDLDVVPVTDMTGRALIDGAKSRIDILSGNIYPPGTYVISIDSSRTLFFVDPLANSYTEVNTTGLASAIGGGRVSVSNIEHSVREADDHPTIAGFPTKHFQMTIKYDMTVQFGNMPITQRVNTTIDKWTTNAFSDASDYFMSVAALRTGNPQLDQVIDLETSKVQGFPLRQIVKITTTTTGRPVAGSQLKLNPTRVQSREILVTRIGETQASPASFTIPSRYKRAETGDVKPEVQILSMEPSTK